MDPPFFDAKCKGVFPSRSCLFISASRFLFRRIYLFDFWYFVEEEEEEYDRRNKA
jgi:hypothetical protein